jgi:hypothetical protein
VAAVARITIGAPLLALVLAAFVVALLVEWIGDLVTVIPQGEDQ